ncbi:threonine-phosphate decarboxylase CobD [Alkalihalobacillus sp. AL-G]|nr:threonine-phosphate decarboxylase CobD [Alkalihalobacillus sp. AL-G]WLD95401.1 threonine-phosphate decarboxylase CobD [Alkalihalobacillus sp. AL-G]
MPEDYIDFSLNINPLGPPRILKEKWLEFYDTIIDYPDPYANTLRKEISKQENVHKDSVLIGNGGAELINVVARMLSRKRVMLVQPTFSEYEQSCLTSDCSIRYHQLHGPDWELRVDDIAGTLQDIDALFLCNPNNPTGVHYAKKTIEQLIQACQHNGCFLILDEAFYDMTDGGDSVLSFLEEYRNLIVIRSLTKMFAVPGLRLGYMIAQPTTIRQLASYQSHWSVNAIALAAGSLCIQEEEFTDKTQNFIRDEREKLFAFYEREEFNVSPSGVNFYLLRDPAYNGQLPLFRFLLQKGIVPRHTMNFPGLEGNWLRFAIKSSNENDRLMEVLRTWKRHAR